MKQSDIDTLGFNNGEQIEGFHCRIIILQQEIIFYGENVSPTILLFQYMKAFSNSNKLKAFITPKMKDIIAFLENNGKLDVYAGGNIHGLYCYLEIIGYPTTFTTSGQSSHNLGPSYSTNNDTETLHPFIAALSIRQKIICEFCGRIGHNYYACIIHGPKLLPPSLQINTNQFKALHNDEPTDTPR